MYKIHGKKYTTEHKIRMLLNMMSISKCNTCQLNKYSVYHKQKLLTSSSTGMNVPPPPVTDMDWPTFDAVTPGDIVSHGSMPGGGE